MADLRTEKQIRQELEAQRALMNDMSRGANLRKKDAEIVLKLEKELEDVLDRQNEKKREQARIDREIKRTTEANADIMKTLNSLITKTVVEEKKMATQSGTVAKLKAAVNKSSSKILNDIKGHASSNRVVNSIMQEQVGVVESIMTGTNDISGMLDQQTLSEDRLVRIQEEKAKWGRLLTLAEDAGKKSLAEKVRIRIEDLDTTEKIEKRLQKVTEEELKQLRAQKQKRSEMSFLDQLTGGLASKAMEFSEAFSEDIPTGGYLVATAFLASMIAMANKFAGMVDSIGKEFGSLAVMGSGFRDTLIESSVEAGVIGGSIEDLNALTTTLSSNFGVNVDNAAELSGAILDSSIAMGLTSAEGGNLFGVLMQTSNLSRTQAESLAEGTFQLARQAGVAPQAVMKDIAGSAESIADFTTGSAENIAEAAVQARALGVSLDTSAKVAKSLLDFESSMAAEVEASVLLGRQLNFQKARELALNNDLSGAMANVVSQLGSEEEFNRLNVIQREALAKSIGVSTAELSKFVGEQEKATSLASMLAAGPNFENLVGKDTLSMITQFLNNIKALGAELTVVLGPTFEMFGTIFGRIAAGLRESEALMTVLAGTAKITAFALMAKAIAATFSAFASLGLVGIPLGIIAVGALTAAYASGVSKVQNVGDMYAGPGGISHMVGPAGTFELNPKDSVLATTNPIPVQKVNDSTFGGDIIPGHTTPIPSTNQSLSAAEIGKAIADNISLKTGVENNTLSIAVDSATQPMGGKSLTK